MEIFILVLSIVTLVISVTIFCEVSGIFEIIEDVITIIIVKIKDRNIEEMTVEEYNEMWRKYLY